MRISSKGDVGIGNPATLPVAVTGYNWLIVGPSAASANSGQICVCGNTTTSGNSVGNFAFINYASTSSDQRVAQIYCLVDGAANSGAIGFSTYSLGNSAERMRITSAGNVGIGTSAPQVALHVAADVARQLWLTSSSSPTAKVMKMGYDVSNNTTVIEGFVSSGSPVNLLLNPAGGNVGIGTTSPQSILHAYQAASGAIASISIENPGSVTGVGQGIDFRGGPLLGGIYHFFDGTRWDLGFKVWNNSAPVQRMTIQGDTGNVGIGTTSPSTVLSTGTSAAPIKIALYDGGGSAVYGIGVNLGGYITFGANINPASGTPQMVLTNTGNVGIGTTSPTKRVHIYGAGQTAGGTLPGGVYWPAQSDLASLFIQDSGSSYGNGGSILLGAIWDPFVCIKGFVTAGAGSGGSIGQLVIYMRNSTSDTGFNQRLQLDNAGNLDITGQYRVNGAAATASVSVFANGTLYGTRPRLNFAGGNAMTLYMSDDGTNNWVTTTYAYASDLRLKQNVAALTGGLPVIDQLRPVEFEWNGLAGHRVGRRAVAVVAQELRDILPECVYPVRTKLRPEDDEPSDVLCYEPTEIVMHLVLAVQQLSARLKQLEGKKVN
jgi:hypothetical protein